MVHLDVLFDAAAITPADTTGRVVAVIDVLRASTTVAIALANGARHVVPFQSTEEVILRSKQFERGDVRLAGERKMLAVPGFDLGNSPREFTPAIVGGKTILFSTTNGTVALLAVTGARETVVASYVNFSVVAALLRAALRGGTAVTIVCAGRDRQFSLEDAACAGRYVRAITKRLAGVQMNDAAMAAALLDRRYGDNLSLLFADSVHGQALAAAGFEEDLVICGTLDSYPVVPIYLEQRITKLGPDWER